MVMLSSRQVYCHVGYRPVSKHHNSVPVQYAVSYADPYQTPISHGQGSITTLETRLRTVKCDLGYTNIQVFLNSICYDNKICILSFIIHNSI